MRVTIRDMRLMKRRGERIPMLTAYDYTSARLVEAAGVPVILVGDSLGQWLLGYETTLPVTMDDMVHHVKAVVRATKTAHVVADMPFMSYQADAGDAVRNAGRMLQEGGAQSVKLEGGAAVAPTVRNLVAAGIPAMGHVGFTPQSYNQLGGYRVQGRFPKAAAALIDDAAAAGVRGMLLGRPGDGPGAAGGADNRASVHTHDRHRFGRALRRPGAGVPRHARTDRGLRAQARAPIRRPRRDHQERRLRVRGRRQGGELSGRRGEPSYEAGGAGEARDGSRGGPIAVSSGRVPERSVRRAALQDGLPRRPSTGYASGRDTADLPLTVGAYAPLARWDIPSTGRTIVCWPILAIRIRNNQQSGIGNPIVITDRYTVVTEPWIQPTTGPPAVYSQALTGLKRLHIVVVGSSGDLVPPDLKNWVSRCGMLALKAVP